MFEIETIKPEKALEIIETRYPTGLFIAKDGEKYIAIDNMTADAWTEEFYSLYVANCWLMETMDTDEAHEVDDCIEKITGFVQLWNKDLRWEQCHELAEHKIIELRKGE